MIKSLLFSGGTFFTKMVLQIGVFVYFAKMLSVDNFGLISYAFTLFWFVSNLSDYGFRIKIVKDVSQVKTNYIDILKCSDTIKIYISLFLFFIFLVYAYIGEMEINKVLFILGYMFSGLVLSLANGRFAVLQAVGRFGLELKVNAISIIFYCISIFWIVWFEVYFSYLAVSFIGYTLFQLFTSSYHLKVNFCYFIINFNKIKDEVQLATPYALLVVANVIFASVDTILIEFFSDYASVAVYQVFVRVNTGFMLIFNVIYTILLPRFAKEIKENDYNFIRKVNSMIILTACLMVVVYQSIDNFIIDFLFGESYLEIVGFSFAISLICIIKYSLWFSNELMLVCSENQKERAKSYIMGMIVTLILFLLVIPVWGWKGAVVSSLLGNFIIGVIYFYYVKQRLRINIYTYKDIILIGVVLIYIGFGSFFKVLFC